MATFIKEHDPYQHPVLLHTHSEDPLRSDILNDVLGFTYIDGLSLQQSKREEAGEVIETWRKRSKEVGHEWLITMDEIGMWHTGAKPDAMDPGHPSLLRYALWGTLLSGAAGVEWYFGAHYPQNDLSSENWREREQLWNLSAHAKSFFNKHLPFWRMRPNHQLVKNTGAYCFHTPGKIYAIYLPQASKAQLDLKEQQGRFEIKWYDPIRGGELQEGTIKTIHGGTNQDLGRPPSNSSNKQQKDWVVLVKKMEEKQ